MYPNVHGVVGTISAIATYKITNDYFISGLVAFLSHDLMDRLGEFNFKNVLYFEAVLFAIFCFLAWRSDNTILYVIGWICGNLMDLIDKKFGLSIYDNVKHPYGQFFKCHRRKPNIDLNLWQTIAVGILSTLILVLISLTK